MKNNETNPTTPQLTEAEINAIESLYRSQWVKAATEYVPALIRDLRALRAENQQLRTSFEMSEANRTSDNQCHRDLMRTKEDENAALREQLAETQSERKIAVRYLSKQGFARCDQPEHGCDGWHERLTP